MMLEDYAFGIVCRGMKVKFVAVISSSTDLLLKCNQSLFQLLKYKEDFPVLRVTR